jgi:rod shape-determining protein MreB
MPRRFSFLGRDLAVDFGTSRLRILAPGEGVVFDVPSAVAYDTRSGRILAYGDDALRMRGRTPPSVETVHPIKEGTVAEFEIARWLLGHGLAAVCGPSRLNRPRAVLSIPQGGTDVTRRALADTCLQAGARDVQLVDSSLAAAYGAGLPIHEASGAMLVDIGAGSTEVAVLALNEVIGCRRSTVAGDAFDAAIMDHFRHEHCLGLSRSAAEDLKIRIGAAADSPTIPPEKFPVHGRQLRTGLPATVRVTSDEIARAVRRPLLSLIDSVGQVLDGCPPELSQDLADRGIVLTGAGALLHGLREQLEEATGLPVLLAEDPGTATVRGSGLYAAAYQTTRKERARASEVRVPENVAS